MAASHDAPPQPPGRLARILAFTAGRRSKWVVLVTMLLLAMGFASQAGKFEQAQKNETESFLPGGAESVKAFELNKRVFDKGDVAQAVVVYSRADGLTAPDRARIARDRASLTANPPRYVSRPSPPVLSRDGRAALLIANVTAQQGNSTKFKDAVQAVRDRVHENGTGGLAVKVTGPAGFSLDAIKVFGNINGTLLLVTGLLVLVLLIVIYRSPIFWAIPFFTVLMAEASARGIGYLLAEAGVTINGQSGGILPVLVFGAGTDYALLLVSRYREELRHVEDKHEALRRALTTAGPAVFASALTVVCALLTLVVAEVNGTSGLGPIGAMGVAIAMIFMLTLLPALLGVFGRRAFWPFVPHLGDAGTDVTHGPWRRIGERIQRRPRPVWIGGAALLLVLAAGSFEVNTGLTQANGFRDKVEAVEGQQLLERSFPAGSSAPAQVLVRDPARVPAVAAALRAHPELVSRIASVRRADGLTRIDAVLRTDPYTTAAENAIPPLRRVVRGAAGGASGAVLVGGQTAAEHDFKSSATRDNRVVIPLALAVVMLILSLLLRAVLGPALLVLSTIVSFAAALGFGIFVFEHVFHYPGIDPSLPLLCFVFLVALGIDYNIFLMARVREETQRLGTREGMLRGLAVTGTVITSAGIVLAGTFSALAVLPLVSLTEIGFVIAFGVLLDTFVVRSIIVPALVLDIGAATWWPSRLDRPRRGEPPPGAPPAERREREPAPAGR